MNILNRIYVVNVYGRIYSVGLFKLLVVMIYHVFKDISVSVKSNFRVIGSYVR